MGKVPRPPTPRSGEFTPLSSQSCHRAGKSSYTVPARSQSVTMSAVEGTEAWILRRRWRAPLVQAGRLCEGSGDARSWARLGESVIQVRQPQPCQQGRNSQASGQPGLAHRQRGAVELADAAILAGTDSIFFDASMHPTVHKVPASMWDAGSGRSSPNCTQDFRTARIQGHETVSLSFKGGGYGGGLSYSCGDVQPARGGIWRSSSYRRIPVRSRARGYARCARLGLE